MDISTQIRTTMDLAWLPHLYSAVRRLRTRSVEIDIPARENAAVIQYTLLGIELKVGKRRFACPDLATARYMRVFARAGVTAFAIPYDITQISGVADEMEVSWQRMLILCCDASKGEPAIVANRRRSRVIKAIREQIAEIGPGDAMPQFASSTTQRP